MAATKEVPGAHTPWITVNQLLRNDERFDVENGEWKGILLAPKEVSQLAALLFYLKQEQLPFCVQGRGTTFSPATEGPIIVVSARAFSQMTLREWGVVEVGAGATLGQLHSTLLEQRQEVSFEGQPLGSSKRSVGGVLLSGQTGGLCLRGENGREALVGAEFVTFDGSRIQWGSNYRSVVAGPAHHQLLRGMQSFPGILVNLMFKTMPLPQSRLRLAWTFQDRRLLWEQFKVLHRFATTWERLDCVLSGTLEEKGVILAQISGLEEEMDAFREHCPAFEVAQQSDDGLQWKVYLSSKRLHVVSGSVCHKLKPGEYFWYHGLEDRGWRMIPEPQKKFVAQAVWKERFDGAMGKSL